MVVDKVLGSAAAAVADIGDRASIGIAGFGVAHRFPSSLIVALRDAGPTGLTVYCNGTVVNLGAGLPALVANFLAERAVVLHAENGMLNYGAFVSGGSGSGFRLEEVARGFSVDEVLALTPMGICVADRVRIMQESWGG